MCVHVCVCVLCACVHACVCACVCMSIVYVVCMSVKNTVQCVDPRLCIKAHGKYTFSRPLLLIALPYVFDLVDHMYSRVKYGPMLKQTYCT